MVTVDNGLACSPKFKRPPEATDQGQVKGSGVRCFGLIAEQWTGQGQQGTP